jgi:hypothetical protein
MTSVVGKWDLRITWIVGKLPGIELNVSDPTFNADGTWTDPANHRGRWLQIGDLVVWNVTNTIPINLVYSGCIQSGPAAGDASMTGIMAKWIEDGDHGTFSARLLFTDPETEPRVGVPDTSDPLSDPGFDPLLGR